MLQQLPLLQSVHGHLSSGTRTWHTCVTGASNLCILCYDFHWFALQSFSFRLALAGKTPLVGQEHDPHRALKTAKTFLMAQTQKLPSRTCSLFFLPTIIPPLVSTCTPWLLSLDGIVIYPKKTNSLLLNQSVPDFH